MVNCMGYNAKNYTEQGGDRTVINGEIVINGKLTVNEEAEVKGVEKYPYTLPQASANKIGGVKEAANVPISNAETVEELSGDFNELLVRLKDSGVIAKDEFNINVIAIPTPVNTDLILNHSKVEDITFNENLVTVKVPVNELVAFNSDNPEQGIHKWLGLSIATGLNSIIGVIYNETYSLAQTDVDEATIVGCPAGSLVLWIKCDELLLNPKVITLSKPGYKAETLTLEIDDIE